MAENLLSVIEAAQLLGVSGQYVRTLIRKGNLPATRVGKTWVIDPNVLERVSTNKEVVKKEVVDHAYRGEPKKKIKALSFFSGAMGLDIGLEKAGIEVLLASEVDKACRETINANKPHIALIGDIRNYSAQKIREMAGLSEKETVDLMVGGPPCQAFSTAGKRMGLEDERGNVYLTFIDRIIEIKPRYAVIENVRGLLSAPLSHRPHVERGFGYPPLTPDEEKGKVLELILGKLRGAGYAVSFTLYNSANFGVPQVRERVILICSRDGKKPPYLTPTHSQDGLYGLPKWKPLRDALKGLKEKDQRFIKFPEKRLKYYRMLKAGQYWKDLPPEIQKEAMGNSYFAGGGKTGFLRRLAWDKPSPTVVTHPAMPATDLAHPEKDRPLSVQEYKRIQEFPDDYKIMGSMVDQYRQIGNAVPIGLGEAVGKLIVSLLDKEKIKQLPYFPYSRYQDTDDVSWGKLMVARANIVEQLSLPLTRRAG